MNFFKKLNSQKFQKLPSVLIKVFIALLMIVALIISANKIIEYKQIIGEIELLEKIENNKSRQVEELKYYLNSNIDDKYKERMARLLGYCYPDEIIYFVE